MRLLPLLLTHQIGIDPTNHRTAEHFGRCDFDAVDDGLVVAQWTEVNAGAKFGRDVRKRSSATVAPTTDARRTTLHTCVGGFCNKELAFIIVACLDLCRDASTHVASTIVGSRTQCGKVFLAGPYSASLFDRARTLKEHARVRTHSIRALSSNLSVFPGTCCVDRSKPRFVGRLGDEVHM